MEFCLVDSLVISYECGYHAENNHGLRKNNVNFCDGINTNVREIPFYESKASYSYNPRRFRYYEKGKEGFEPVSLNVLYLVPTKDKLYKHLYDIELYDKKIESTDETLPFLWHIKSVLD